MTGSHRDDLRTSYDNNAADRDRIEISSWKAKERQMFLDLLHVENRVTLLELGSGPGRDGLFFQENGLTVTCTDLSLEMVEHCRRKGLNAQVMDMAELTFAGASFDAIYASSSLLHLPKRECPKVLAGIKRVLVASGLFFMGVWGGWDFEGIWEKDPYQPQRFFAIYTDRDMQDIVSQFFEVVSFKSLVVGHRTEDERYQVMVLRK